MFFIFVSARLVCAHVGIKLIALDSTDDYDGTIGQRKKQHSTDCCLELQSQVIAYVTSIQYHLHKLEIETLSFSLS